jgi:hypothetical protein
MFGVLLLALNVWSCRLPLKEVESEQAVWERKKIALMRSVGEKLQGTWKIKRIELKGVSSQQREARIFQDTTLRDFGTLHLTHIQFDSQGIPSGSGRLQYWGYTRAITLESIVPGTRVTSETGPYAVLSLTIFLPRNQIHSSDADYFALSFPDKIHLDGSFTLEALSDRTMVWYGVDRRLTGMERIEFEKM